VWVEVLLETDRLILRRLTDADSDELVALDADPEVMRYLTGGRPTPREVIEREILPRFRSYGEYAPGFGYWAAVERRGSAFLGWFSLRPIADGHDDEVELGYRLRRAVWGQGYASEGARALVRKAFVDLGVRRVVATTYEENAASRRVMEKAGLRLVRRFRLTIADLQTAATFDASSVELFDGYDVEYALDKDEWEREGRDAGSPAGPVRERRGV
jgi:RimJ/RimL family protein N-acetyltransferase